MIKKDSEETTLRSHVNVICKNQLTLMIKYLCIHVFLFRKYYRSCMISYVK